MGSEIFQKSRNISEKRRLRDSVADPGSGAFLNPGSGIGKKIKIRIRDEHPGLYFRELRKPLSG
jgi:hypothetical protein